MPHCTKTKIHAGTAATCTTSMDSFSGFPHVFYTTILHSTYRSNVPKRLGRDRVATAASQPSAAVLLIYLGSNRMVSRHRLSEMRRFLASFPLEYVILCRRETSASLVVPPVGHKCSLLLFSAVWQMIRGHDKGKRYSFMSAHIVSSSTHGSKVCLTPFSCL